ncbi:MAG: hypothetical protein ACO3ZG_07245, partial [Kiritimatiellia bacterium]
MRSIRLAALVAILISPVHLFRATAQDMDFDALLDELTFEVDETAPLTTPEPAPVIEKEEHFSEDLFGEEPTESTGENFGFDEKPIPAPVDSEASFDDLFGSGDGGEASPLAPAMEEENLFGME